MMREPDRPVYRETDPRYHTTRLKNMMGDLIDHMRKDVHVVNDPRAKAMYEVSAEVLKGLQKAFDDYERGEEAAWQR